MRLTAHADLYAVSAHGLLFTYPPFAAITFLPLAAAEGAAGWLLTVLSLMALRVSSEWSSPDRLRLSTSTTLVVLAGALVLEPVTRTLVLGQINLILMALVVADLFVVPRRGEAYSSASPQV